MLTSRSALGLMLGLFFASACSGAPEGDDDVTDVVDDEVRSGVVRVYTGSAFGGKKLSLGVGDHALAGKGFDDVVRSVRVFGDYSVELFVDANYAGQSLRVSADTQDLGALAGKVSSVRIRATRGSGETPAPTPNPTPTPAPTPPPPSGGGDTSTAVAGWAAVAGLGVATTRGGAGGAVYTVSSVAEFNARAGGDAPAIVRVASALRGDFVIGSNKTVVGAGGSLTGHVEMKGSVNVIVQRLAVTGYNCTDSADCQGGADAITVTKNAHHLWFDHLDVKDGSDGNLDIAHASDYVTVSWTKFSYSGVRKGGHQFSNLVGHSDDNPEDEGHLRVTFHHDWWADNVVERMPRVRYGQVHAYNNLFTAAGNGYCFRAGMEAKILSENNAFVGVDTPFDLAGGDVRSVGDLFEKTTGNAKGTGTAFTPPYAYDLESAAAVKVSVRNGAGAR